MVGVELFLPVEEGLRGRVLSVVCLLVKRRRGGKEERELREVGPGKPQNRRVNRGRLGLARSQFWILRCECKA